MTDKVTYKWMEGYDVVFGEDVEEKEITEFSELLDSTESKQFKEGEVFNGRVVSIGQDYVMVDIGYKQEGLVSVKEFQNFDSSTEKVLKRLEGALKDVNNLQTRINVLGRTLDRGADHLNDLEEEN